MQGIFAFEFFRFTIGLVISLAVAAVVAVLGYQLRRLNRKVDELENALGVWDEYYYGRWVAETEPEQVESNGNGHRPQRGHLRLLGLVPIVWATADRVARRPLAAAAMAGAVVAATSMTTLPSVRHPSPPAVDAAPSPSVIAPAPEHETFAFAKSSTTTLPTTTTTSVTSTTSMPSSTSTTTPLSSTTTTSSTPTTTTTLADVLPSKIPSEALPKIPLTCGTTTTVVTIKCLPPTAGGG